MRKATSLEDPFKEKKNNNWLSDTVRRKTPILGLNMLWYSRLSDGSSNSRQVSKRGARAFAGLKGKQGNYTVVANSSGSRVFLRKREGVGHRLTLYWQVPVDRVCPTTRITKKKHWAESCCH